MPLTRMYEIPFVIDDDQLWMEFAVRIVNIATWDRPDSERLGQRLMNGLAEESPMIFELITDTENDIWEMDLNDPLLDLRLNKFWKRLYDAFIAFL